MNLYVVYYSMESSFQLVSTRARCGVHCLVVMVCRALRMIHIINMVGDVTPCCAAIALLKAQLMSRIPPSVAALSIIQISGVSRSCKVREPQLLTLILSK